MEYDGEHIWLRQSVTQTIEGQTRTLEIGVSVRPGMTTDQIEALLHEADAGMRRLSSHLDSQISGFTSPVSLSRNAALPSPVAPPALPAVAPAVPSPVAPAVPSPVAPAVPSPVAPAVPSPVALSVKDFVAAVRTELDLNPKQAMEKLKVKSLTGLNLHEALEMLRRQALGSTDAAPSTQQSVPAALPHYFEEEDGEFEVTFSLDEDFPESEFATGEPSAMPGMTFHGNNDDPDLEDVPDFDTLPVTESAATHASQHSVPRRAASAGSRMVSAMDTTTLPTESPIDEERSRALQIVRQMRGAAGGGTPTSQQRIAYRNIILQELGEQVTKELVHGLWRVPADRLGADQLDALLSWGKRDSFGGEAELVLAALRAESVQKASAPPTGSRDTNASTPAHPTARSRAGTPPTGGR